jgi:hypothetical protein
MAPLSSVIQFMVLPDMDVKDMLTRYHDVPGDIKGSKSQTESVTDGNNDVTVKKEMDNTHHLEYCVVNYGASRTSMDREINDVKLENVEQTYCDSKMALDVPDTDRPHPVLLVQVKQELDDVDSVCTGHSTTVHCVMHFPECGVSSGEETNNTCDSEDSVKQEVDDTHHCYTAVTEILSELPIAMEVNDVKHEPSTHVEHSSTVSPDAEIGAHTPLPLVPVKNKEEIKDV